MVNKQQQQHMTKNSFDSSNISAIKNFKESRILTDNFSKQSFDKKSQNKTTGKKPARAKIQQQQPAKPRSKTPNFKNLVKDLNVDLDDDEEEDEPMKVR